MTACNIIKRQNLELLHSNEFGTQIEMSGYRNREMTLKEYVLSCYDKALKVNLLFINHQTVCDCVLMFT